MSELQSLASSVSPSIQVYGLSCDVSCSVSLDKAVSDGISLLHDDFDILVASAGMSKPSLFQDLSVTDFDKMFQINSLGCMYSVKAILPSIQKKGAGGRIMIVSSMAGLSGVAGYTAYSASKFALRGFAESLHMELLPQGIAVTIINPPDVDTPMYQEENKVPTLNTHTKHTYTYILRHRQILRQHTHSHIHRHICVLLSNLFDNLTLVIYFFFVCSCVCSRLLPIYF